jgi:metal transporter CNNM
VRSLPLHRVPSVAQNEPLLGILDKFQEGRSHMAIVTRTSVEKASSLKKAVKKSITQRIKNRVGISDSSSDSSSDEGPQSSRRKGKKAIRILERLNASEDSMTMTGTSDRDGTSRSEATSDKDEGGRSFSFRKKRKRSKKRLRLVDVEMGTIKPEPQPEIEPRPQGGQSYSKKGNIVQFAFTPGLEQSMPADAVLAKEGANEVSTRICDVQDAVLTITLQFLLNFDPNVAPLGIITLEDVLEGVYVVRPRWKVPLTCRRIDR